MKNHKRDRSTPCSISSLDLWTIIIISYYINECLHEVKSIHIFLYADIQICSDSKRLSNVSYQVKNILSIFFYILILPKFCSTRTFVFFVYYFKKMYLFVFFQALIPNLSKIYLNCLAALRTSL